MKLIKKGLEIIKKLYKNIWFRTILFISLFLSFYAIREKVDITNNTRTMLNLVLLGVFFVQLYQRLNEKRISIVRFLFIFVAAFILNKFYDTNIFFSFFEIKLNYAITLAGSVIFLYIIGSKAFLLIRNRKKADSKLKNESASFEAIDKEDSTIRKINNYNNIEGNSISTNNLEYKSNFRKEQPEIYADQNGEPKICSDQNVMSQDHLDKNKVTNFSNQSVKSYRGINILIFVVILLLSALSLIPFLDNEILDKLTGIDVSNGFSAYFTVMGFIFLWIFMWTVIVTVFIKLWQIVMNVIKNKDSHSNYLLNASAFLAVSYFITKQYNISLDKIVDSILQGNILSFPILLLILLPLFFTLLQNLETLIRKNEEIKEKTVNLIYELIISIIIALLNFIKFTTADFLISIQDIVREDLDCGVEIEKPLGVNLVEQEDGEANDQSRESEPDSNKE